MYSYVSIDLYQEALQHHELLTEQESKQFCIFWRATDIERECRQVLRSHPTGSKPRHITSDILDRCKGRDQAGLDKLFKKRMNQFDTALAKPGGEIKSVLVERIGRAYATDLWGELMNIEPDAHVWCTSCEQECLAHPPPAVRSARKYMNCSGNICVPWSALGNRLGWLHQATLPFLCWLRDLVKQEPDVIVQECTANFDGQFYASLIDHSYAVKFVRFSPVQLGLPVRRLRMYSIAVRKDRFVFKVPWSMSSFNDFMWRPVQMAVTEYFRSPNSLLNQRKQELAVLANLPDGLPWPLYLTSAERHRLEGHEMQAVDLCLGFAVSNIKQNANFMPPATVMPAFTTKSTDLWGIGCLSSWVGFPRPLLGYEQLGVHGYPILLDADNNLTKLLPRLFTFRNVFLAEDALPDASFKRLAGNGMHLAAVGVALTFAVMDVWPSCSASQVNAALAVEEPPHKRARKGSAPVMRKPGAAVMRKPAAAMSSS